MNNTQLAQKSIDQLFRDLGMKRPYSLTIKVTPNAGPIAYISGNHIGISRRLLDEAPQQLKVYLAHELWHPVVERPELRSAYPAQLMNRAEDYSINWHILKKLGPDYDVRRVLIPGLFDPKLGPLKVKDIADKLVDGRPLPPTWQHLTSHDHSDDIWKITQHIISKFYPKRKQARQLLVIDAVDYDALVEAKPPGIVKPRSFPGLRMNTLAVDLAAKAFQQSPTAEPRKGKLTTQQQLLLGFDPVRQATVGKPDLSWAMVIRYLDNLDNYDYWLRNRALAVRSRLNNLDERKKPFKRGEKVRLRNKLRKLLALREEQAKWKLQRCFTEDPLKLGKPQPVVNTIRRMLTAHLETPGLPRVLSSHTGLALRRCSRRYMHALIETDATLDDLEKALGPLLGAPPDEQEEGDDEKGEGGGDEGEQQGKHSDSDRETDGDEGEKKGDGEKEEGGGETVGTHGTDNSRDDAEGGAGDGGSADSDNGRQGGGSPSQGQGLGCGSTNKANLILRASEFNNLLALIQSFVLLFETRFQGRARKPNEANNTVETTLGYGNDVAKACGEDLALLQAVPLLFFQRVADHELIVEHPIETRRQAVHISIDCSGSMYDKFPAACGFALAIAKILLKERRGCVLSLFSSHIVAYLDLHDEQATFAQVVNWILSNADFGGTAFGPPLLFSYAKKEEHNWKSMYTLLITDGQGGVDSDSSDKLATLKGPHDKHHALLARGRTVGSREEFDTISYCVGSTLVNELVKAGLRFL